MRECESCGRCLEDDAAACCPAGGPWVEPFPGPALLDGKYLLERRLGAGGMGAVYLAVHTGLGKTFAVKVVRPLLAASPQALARFRIEAQALGRLSHPHVVGVTDYGVDPRDGGLPYLVMEHLPGESLLGRIQRLGPLAPDEAVRLLGPVAEALGHAHSLGILHRDLKPSNVFLAADGQGPLTPKLLDFGLARFADAGPEPPLPGAAPPSDAGDMPTVPFASCVPTSSGPGGTGLPAALTAPEGIVGTPQFFAPELIEGAPPSRATDLWAFGVLAYATVTGTLPWEGATPELLEKILREPPEPPSARRPGLDPALDAVLLAPLAREPALRPASASEWLRSVRRRVRELHLKQLRSRERPRRLLLAAAIAAGLGLVSAAAVPLAPFAAADRALLDIRYRLAPARQADPRLLLVSIDEAALRADATPLTARGDEAATLLEAAFDAGAAGVAVDLLLPPAWGRSPSFGRAVVSNAPRLAFAALAASGDDVVGPEALEGPVALALGAEAASLFGVANLTPDADGAVRRARTGFPAEAGGSVPSLAARAASLLGKGPTGASRAFVVDHRIDASGFRRLSFHEAAVRLRQEPDRVARNLLLLGAEYEGSGDLHPNPRDRRRPLSGLQLQALSVQTLVDGEPLRDAPRLLVAALFLPPLFAVSFGLLWLPGRAAGLLAIALAALFPLATAVAAFLAAGLVVPVAAPAAALALAGGGAALLRRRLPALQEV